MAAECDVDMPGEGESLVKTYIAIDTNVMLDHLPVVQALFQVLSIPELNCSIRILIPQTVLYELDNHHKSGNQHVRDRARVANMFLKEVIKSRRCNSHVPLRFQKLSEMSDHLQPKAAKPDDKHILDCCLTFKRRCDVIWLWTKDNIFDTIAESNDINVTNSRDLSGMIEAIGLSKDPLVISQVQIDKSRPPQHEPVEDSGMDIDEVLYLDLPTLINNQERSDTELVPGPDGSRSLLSDYLARYSASSPAPFDADVGNISSGFVTPPSARSRHSRTGSTTPAKLSVYDVHDRLDILLQPLLSLLGVHSPRSDRFLRHLLACLMELEKKLCSTSAESTAVSANQQQLLIGISATRILVRYCETDFKVKEPRPRINDVVGAIKSLGEMCLSAGLGEEVHRDLSRFASEVRESGL